MRAMTAVVPEGREALEAKEIVANLVASLSHLVAVKVAAHPVVEMIVVNGVKLVSALVVVIASLITQLFVIFTKRIDVRTGRIVNSSTS